MLRKIKFTHFYPKLGKNPDKAILLEVLCFRRINVFHKSFLDYDADNGKFKFNKSVPYMMLIFQKTNDSNIFTTLRTYNPEKHRYYLSGIGKEFLIEIKGGF